jgi:radical SAM protein with 4Fe4S-binding SPASM domain
MTFQMSDLPVSKIVNLAINRIDRSFRLYRPYSYPIAIQLEPTIACQLDCPLCPRQITNQKNDEIHMPWDSYESVINEIGPSTLAIAFWQWGEPLLHPRIIDMISLASRFRILSFLSTNGQMDANSAYLQELFRAGLDLLIISLDGLTPSGYQSFRQRGVLEKVLNFTEQAVAAKRHLKSQAPVINVRTIATRENEHEIDDIRRFAAAAGADLYSVKSVSLYYDSSPDSESLPNRKDYRSFQYQGQREATEYRLMPNYCSKPWSWPTLRYDGTLLVCECDHSSEYPLGNVFSEGEFRKVWRNEQADAVRRRFKPDGEINAEFCNRCRYKLDDAIRDITYFNA